MEPIMKKRKIDHDLSEMMGGMSLGQVVFDESLLVSEFENMFCLPTIKKSDNYDKCMDELRCIPLRHPVAHGTLTDEEAQTIDDMIKDNRKKSQEMYIINKKIVDTARGVRYLHHKMLDEIVGHQTPVSRALDIIFAPPTEFDLNRMSTIAEADRVWQKLMIAQYDMRNKYPHLVPRQRIIGHKKRKR